MSHSVDCLTQFLICFDLSHKGYLTVDEFRNISQPLFQAACIPQGDISRAIKRSTNCFGMVNILEFVQILSEMASVHCKADNNWRTYKYFDNSLKGRITVEDILQVAAETSVRISSNVVKRIVSFSCEYPEKGISFDEWKSILNSSP